VTSCEKARRAQRRFSNNVGHTVMACREEAHFGLTGME
jgi:hypothetical protein